MKIIVKESNCNIRLRLPTGLILNRWSAAFLCREAEKHGMKFNPSQMLALIKALNHYRRSHPDWVLAEVSGAKGEYVIVKI